MTDNQAGSLWGRRSRSTWDATGIDATAAFVKARTRLHAALNVAQRHELDSMGYFTVIAPSGNKYMINTLDPVSNIFCYATHRRYCLHLGEIGYDWPRWPTPDHLLAQALLLRTDEILFLDLAHDMGKF